MRSFIRARRGRTTLVISSHQLGDIEELCTHVAFVEAGKVERMETLSALTSASGRVVYALARAPEGVCAEGCELSWNEEKGELAVDYAAERAVEDVNAQLLPLLLPFGVRSVVAGRSLEEVYLNKTR